MGKKKDSAVLVTSLCVFSLWFAFVGFVYFFRPHFFLIQPFKCIIKTEYLISSTTLIKT